MRESCSVLFLGPSSISHSEPGDGGSIQEIVEDLVKQEAPDVEWTFTRQTLFLSPRMDARATGR